MACSRASISKDNWLIYEDVKQMYGIYYQSHVPENMTQYSTTILKSPAQAVQFVLQVTVVVIEKTRLKLSNQVVYPNKRRVRGNNASNEQIV